PHVFARPFLMSAASNHGRRRHLTRDQTLKSRLALARGPPKGWTPTPTALHVARRVLASERRRLRGDALSSDPRSNISIPAASRAARSVRSTGNFERTRSTQRPVCLRTQDRTVSHY